jgi:hypothetical protein
LFPAEELEAFPRLLLLISSLQDPQATMPEFRFSKWIDTHKFLCCGIHYEFSAKKREDVFPPFWVESDLFTCL